MIEINNQFIKQHDRLVRVIVNQYQTKGIDKQDLIQEGYLGLIEAAQRYDASTGIQFSSYASWWIRKYVRNSIAQFINILPVPTRSGDEYTRKKRSFDDVFAIEEGEVITFAETITDGDYIEQTLIEQEEQTELHKRLRRALDSLSNNERRVIQHLYGFDAEEMSLEEIARLTGFSPEWIRRLKIRALKQLREQGSIAK